MQHSPRISFFARNGLVFALGLFVFASVAFADSLRVQPEQLSLSAANPVEKLKFHNTSDEESVLHFEVVRWQQDYTREWFTPSRELIVLPSTLKLKAGESGEVRVSLRLSGSWWEEEAFRIMVTQTSRIPDVGDDYGYSSTGRISRPSSLPVYLLPPGDATPRLFWSFKRHPENGVVLSASNSGHGHIRLNSASLVGPTGQMLEKGNMSDVLLPGGARSWVLAPDATAGLWFLTAETDEGPIRTQVVLEPGDSTATALSYSQ